MNFLCHAIPYLDEPMVAVCTAVPDWLSVVDRKIRARERMAVAALDEKDTELAAVATGILHHIRDDRWFHATAAFAETNLTLAVQLREELPGDQGFRPMFVGHILIEMFLDGFWIRDDPRLAKQYYDFVDGACASTIQRCVNQITRKPTDRLVQTIRRFAEMQFLYDYLDEESLLYRINQVMRRVRLNELPDSVLPWIATARELVESRRESLLTPPNAPQPIAPSPRNDDR